MSYSLSPPLLDVA